MIDSSGSDRMFVKSDNQLFEELFQSSDSQIGLYKGVEVRYTDEQYIDRVGAGRDYSKYLREFTYYFSDSTGFYPIGSWKTLLTYLNTHQKEVKSYIKVNHLTFGNENHMKYVYEYHRKVQNSSTALIEQKREIIRIKMGGMLSSYSHDYQYQTSQAVGGGRYNRGTLSFEYQDNGTKYTILPTIETAFYISRNLTLGFQYLPFKYESYSSDEDSVVVEDKIFPPTHPWSIGDSLITSSGNLTRDVRFQMLSPLLTFEQKLLKDLNLGCSVGYIFAWNNDNGDKFTASDFTSFTGGIELSWKRFVYLKYQYVPFQSDIRYYSDDDGNVVRYSKDEISNLSTITFGVSYTFGVDRETLILTD